MKKQISLLLVISFLLLVQVCQAQSNTIELYFFYGQGCPHCAQAEQFLTQLSKQYPALAIKSFEVFFNQDNRQIYFSLANAYKINVAEVPVPVIFIGEKSFVGYDDFIGSQIRNEVLRCLNQKCPSPIEKLSSDNQNPPSNSGGSLKQIMIGWAVIIVLGAIFVLGAVKLINKITRKKCSPKA